ncbi:MAG: symmetrical bis(5'-nucleosyl)-tetraphosphatase [Gammaproteobacteria bacterium]|nr:symmetrical bis(5'-nucleosyl)-tetraphosphatase [Gammaproteobacteria bacterium]
MATYAIGDIQGCFEPLQALLQKIDFDPQQDTLWFTGDLVNRGPNSLETLRYIKGLGSAAITVLGNHDLHLLAVHEGQQKFQHDSDTLTPILQADDRDELLSWLRHQPLLHHDEQLQMTMIHAGLPPQWDLALARTAAAEVEAVLRSEDYLDFFNHMYGNLPDVWSDKLQGHDRLRFIVNCFTRLRFCTDHGKLALSAKGAPGTQPQGMRPWFQISGRSSAGNSIIFGHWSTLGLHLDDNVISLDTGCLWGGELTALRLEDRKVFNWNCEQAMRPGI